MRKKKTKVDLKKTAETFINQANKLVAEIAERRDKLRELISEYNDIAEDTDLAIDEFERALETLSQRL